MFSCFVYFKINEGITYFGNLRSVYVLKHKHDFVSGAFTNKPRSAPDGQVKM